MAILELREISSGYGEVQILWGASMSLEPGKLTSLVGGNGVGKTTLLRTVMGATRPWSGSIWFEGQDVKQNATLHEGRAWPGAGARRAPIVHRHDGCRKP